MAKNNDDADNLTFVVTTNPYDASAVANKKQVRSIAALKSWPERRKRTFEQSESSSSYQGGFVLEAAPPESKASSADVPRSKARTRDDARKRKRPPPPPQPAPSTKSRVSNDPPLFEDCARAIDECCSCSHCRFDRTVSCSPSPDQSTSQDELALATDSSAQRERGVAKPGKDLSMITPPASPLPATLNAISNIGRAEPFNCYPVPYRPWFDRVLHHMMSIYAPRGWPALGITHAESMKWEWFMTQQALAEPALFYVRLLFGSGDLIRLNVLNPEVSYWLKAQAIQAMNEALADPVRAISNPVILAIGRIALYEFQYGDKEASNMVHRPAQARMIAMRGGMKALDFPDLVKRLMRWSDTVMAKQTGTSRILEDEEDNPNFSIKQTVDVLERWVPSEGKDLRNKIRISDLISSDSP